MDCYVEVFNGGIKDVKPGDLIKIPKIKLKKLIKEIVKIFFGGVGKFEVLKYSYIGYWFCRIIDEYRFVYKVEELWIEIIFCKFHYK